MIIGIDGNEANLAQRVGVGQYAYNVIKQLSLLDQKNTYHLYLKNQPLPDMPPESANWHYHVFGPEKLWTKFALPFHLYTDKIKLDLFYSPSHYSPHFCPFPTIPTIHDLGYLSTGDQFTKKDLYQLTSWTKHSLRQAKHIIAVSEFTKNEINRIYNIDKNKISIAYNGVTPPRQILTNPQDVLNKFSIRKPYFLYLGTLKPSKNIPFLIETFSRFLNSSPTPKALKLYSSKVLKDHSSKVLKDYSSKVLKHQLVIAGKKGWLFNTIFQTVQKFNLENSVIFTDYISETEKWILYRQAQATILPSLYEGFGIPAVESQISKCPVIASDIPAFKEILGSSALFINPHDISSLEQAMINIQSPRLKRKMIEKGFAKSLKFSWENSARSLINVFKKV